jgi:L-Ala-D/L-Glu epimerase
MNIDIQCVNYPLHEAFATARDSLQVVPVIVVTLTDSQGRSGRGEAAGVDYAGETQSSMREQIERIAPMLTDSTQPEQLFQMLPVGGARNALDCALWDLLAKRSNARVWELLKLAMSPVQTCVTIGLASEADMRRKTRAALSYSTLKVKVDATQPLATLEWVMSEHPTADIIMDANAAFTRDILKRCLDRLHGTRVRLIEQPLPVGAEQALTGLARTIPLAADESCVDEHSLQSLVGAYDAINIKLDKCGGLTAALRLLNAAKALGFTVMVGNMCGSSLAMAPAMLIAQQAEWVDLDGPLLQTEDVADPIRYANGLMALPSRALWG